LFNIPDTTNANSSTFLTDGSFSLAHLGVETWDAAPVSVLVNVQHAV
jgi:hypothetical protein